MSAENMKDSLLEANGLTENTLDENEKDSLRKMLQTERKNKKGVVYLLIFFFIMFIIMLILTVYFNQKHLELLSHLEFHSSMGYTVKRNMEEIIEMLKILTWFFFGGAMLISFAYLIMTIASFESSIITPGKIDRKLKKIEEMMSKKSSDSQ